MQASTQTFLWRESKGTVVLKMLVVEDITLHLNWFEATATISLHDRGTQGLGL